MKKFLIVLMVVAMASFLFVGCLGTTPPIDPDEPDEPVLPATVTPVIRGIADLVGAPVISLYSSDTQYMNKAEIADGILVYGYAPKYSEVNIYIDGEVVSTGYAYGVLEEFTVFVAEDNLGADGEKTLYATAKELGFDESADSTEYEFILDTVAPKIVSVAAEAEVEALSYDGTITVTCSEALDEGSIDEDSTNHIWDVKDITNDYTNHIVNASVGSELISPEVIEITADLDTTLYEETETPPSGGDLIRVEYEILTDNSDWVYVTDLAGNKLVESVHYCFLEVEE